MGYLAYKSTGFSTLGEYFSSLVRTHNLIARRMFRRRTIEEMVDAKAEGGHDMKSCLGWFDLACLGVGMMLGAGVFVTTGYVAADIAGPAVVLSYVVAGISALLSSLCYAEFATDIPLAGGAYSYISATMGEFFAWLTVANLVFEYILSTAAGARGFAPYFCTLTNKPEGWYYTPWTSPTGEAYELDWIAFALILSLMALLIAGTRESSSFNVVVTIAHILFVVFIIVLGFVKSKPSNAVPFVPPPGPNSEGDTSYGVAGIFNGAAIVFFSYIGFDTVATAAEETRKPGRDIPLGIMSAVGCVTLLYVLMALVLVWMVPVHDMPGGASFAVAMEYVGLNWAKYIVAIGALMGIVTTTMVGQYGVSRIITGVARDHLIPPFISLVSGKLATPWVALLLQGVVSALIGLFTDFADLAEMVSISTLFAFWLVAVGLMWRRHYIHGHTSTKRGVLLSFLLFMIISASIVFTVLWRMIDIQSQWYGLVICAVALIAFTVALHLIVPQEYLPSKFKVPLYPYLPALSIFINTFLMGQLSVQSYERFGIWCAACLAVYLLYGMHASYLKSRKDSDLPMKAEAAEAVAKVES